MAAIARTPSQQPSLSQDLGKVAVEHSLLIKQGQTADLTRLDLPSIQAILKQLGIAPKPRQWQVDKGLQKDLLNTLISQDQIVQSRYHFFIQLRQAFFLMLQRVKDASQSALLRKEQRGVFAMQELGRQFSRAMRSANTKDIQTIRNLYQSMGKQIESLDLQFHMLLELSTKTLADYVVDFYQWSQQDDTLNSFFAEEDEQNIKAFSKDYALRRLDQQVEVETLEQQIAEQEAKEHGQRDLQKIESFRARIQDKHQEHAQLFRQAARQCLGPQCQRQLMDDQMREQLQQRVDAHLSPTLLKLTAFKLRMLENRRNKSDMVEKMEALKAQVPFALQASLEQPKPDNLPKPTVNL